MSTETIQIKAVSRTIGSKADLKSLRSQGLVPGVIYGKKGTHSISLVAKELPKAHTRANLLEISLDGKSTHTVLMREVQVDPVKDSPVHFDFHEVTSEDLITVSVPLEFVGLTKEQEKEGSFKPLLRSLQVKSTVAQLPKSLKVNVSNLKVGDSAHLADLDVPAGVKVSASKSLALASLTSLSN